MRENVTSSVLVCPMDVAYLSVYVSDTIANPLDHHSATPQYLGWALHRTRSAPGVIGNPKTSEIIRARQLSTTARSECVLSTYMAILLQKSTSLSNPNHFLRLFVNSGTLPAV